MEAESTKEFIAKVAANPNAWLLNALKLFASAELLHGKSTQEYYQEIDQLLSRNKEVTTTDALNAFDYLKVSLLLAGYGFESMLKFGYVKANQESMQAMILQNGRIPEELKDHNLVRLAQKVSYPLTATRRVFFEKLTTHSTWAGRYPIPVDEKRFDKSLLSLHWTLGDIEDYYSERDHLFEFFQLDFDLVKNLRVGLTSGSLQDVKRGE
ncbi:MAG TPA: hypothetical protein DGH68_02340 [Bacteroidetes bacterium]|jgi:hypothetical protein|nr:hypothetical protein [Bacteroidota bacterium]